MSSQLAPGLLVASPPLGDPNFDRTVVLLAMHNEHGALGFVINRLAPLQLGELLGLAGYGDGLGDIRGPVYVGGPVEPSSGWVLGEREALGLPGASADAAPALDEGDAASSPSARGSVKPRAGAAARAASVASGRGDAGALVKEAIAGDGEGVIAVGDRLVVTSSRKVFDEVARRAKHGQDAVDPRRLVILGYSGWGPGQLEGEIARGAWLPLPLDPRILFGVDPDERWERMFQLLGVSTLGAASMRSVGSA